MSLHPLWTHTSLHPEDQCSNSQLAHLTTLEDVALSTGHVSLDKTGAVSNAQSTTCKGSVVTDTGSHVSESNILPGCGRAGFLLSHAGALLVAAVLHDQLSIVDTMALEMGLQVSMMKVWL